MSSEASTTYIACWSEGPNSFRVSSCGPDLAGHPTNLYEHGSFFCVHGTGNGDFTFTFFSSRSLPLHWEFWWWCRVYQNPKMGMKVLMLLVIHFSLGRLPISKRMNTWNMLQKIFFVMTQRGVFLVKDIYQSGKVLSTKYRKLSYAYRHALIGFIFLVVTFLSLLFL